MIRSVNAPRSRPLLCALLALLLCALLGCPALARESVPPGCACGLTPCVCFLQAGDEGGAAEAVIIALKQQGYLALKHLKGVLSKDAASAVAAFQTERGLPATGLLDDDTLTRLLWGMTPEELNIARPDTAPDMVYIPTGGGTRRHAKPACSGMDSPRRVSVRNAELMGFLPCKRCKPR